MTHERQKASLRRSVGVFYPGGGDTGLLGGVHTSYYDLFLIENGKIAEHWDTIESILPEDKRLNANGKFGF